MDSLLGKGDRFKKTRGGEGKTITPPRPMDEGYIGELLEKLMEEVKSMKENMATKDSLQRLENDVTALRQLTEENKQAVNEAVKTVKSLETDIEKHVKFVIDQEMEPLTERVSKLEKSVKEGVVGAATRSDAMAAMAANNKIAEAKRLNELLNPECFEPYLKYFMAKTCDMDIKDALKRKDGPYILQMLGALMDLMSTVTHCTVEQFEINMKEGDRKVKKDAYKILIHSPSEAAANHVRSCYFEWIKKAKERCEKDGANVEKLPRIRSPCVGRASRQSRTKLEKSAAEMKNSKEIKSYRSSLYFDKLSGEIRSNISLRVGGKDGQAKIFDSCAQRFAKICDEKGIKYDEKKGVAELDDKDIKTVLMAIIKPEKKEKRARETGEKTGGTPVHTQKSMKNAESVARRLFDDSPVADEAAEESKKASCEQLMES